jgi:hypothetical protein
MHINGWQRLWLLASVIWGVAILAFSGILGSGEAVPSANILFILRLWVVPVVAVYALGVSIAWVGRGFQAESK